MHKDDSSVFNKHHVFLPFGSNKTLSYNIRMFDCLVAKAIDRAIDVKAKGEP